MLLILGILFAFSFLINDNLNFDRGNSIEILESSAVNNLEDVNLKTSTVSGKIHINGNLGWVDAKNAGICTGEGTESDPYIIENLKLDGGGSGSGLLIEHSDVHFKIQSCFIYNSGSNINEAGIELYNVNNGQLLHNILESNSYGLILNTSDSNIIVGNTIKNNDEGIKMVHSSYCLLFLNSVEENEGVDIYFTHSHNVYTSQKNITYIYKGNTYTSYIGNYWSAYEGADEDGDGLGEVKHDIYAHHYPYSQLEDYFPLMEPIENYEYEIKSSDLTVSMFNITSPKRLDEFVAGEQHTIIWTLKGSTTHVLIKLIKGEKFIEDIAISTENDGSFEWTLGYYEAGSNYRLYIQDVSNIIINDYSQLFVISTAVIPGYNLFFLISMICIASVLLLERLKKLLK